MTFKVWLYAIPYVGTVIVDGIENTGLRLEDFMPNIKTYAT